MKYKVLFTTETIHRLEINDRLFDVFIQENPVKVLRSDCKQRSDSSLGFDFPININNLDYFYKDIITKYLMLKLII